MRASSRWFLLVTPLTAVVILLPICSLLAQSSGSAKGAAVSTAPVHPVLVELFTSEGCSSCPPADALLEKMDTQPFAGLQLIVMSEHVTYWDHDGWKDPNSAVIFTDRQSAYEDALGIHTAYTPQIIIDGTNVLRMGDTQQADRVFHEVAGTTKLAVRLEDAVVDAGSPAILRARVEADATAEKRGGDVYLAIALNRVETHVLHGENGGRNLVHVAVVQQLAKVGKLEKGKAFDQQIQLKLRPGEDLRNLRVIAFVQEPGPGKVLGATWQKIGS